MPVELKPSLELDDASLERTCRVSGIPTGAHVHVSGACGTGMASVLQLLKSLGYHVTGSDKAFYPPMGDVVRRTADRVFEGYSAENLKPHPALTVIGNSLSRGNPEVEYVLENGLPFASMPEVFAGLLIGTREHCPTSIVITGTHGKTTTTAATAVIFESAGLRPGYFVGGVPKNLPGSIRKVDTTVPADKRVVVLEGDEYDSAFFAKFSKFHSYRPDLLAVTSIEFDHADIYNSLEEIEAEFTKLVKRVPPAGAVLVAEGGEALERLVLLWKGDPDVKAPIYRYGERISSELRLLKRSPIPNGGQELELDLLGTTVSCRTTLTGPHNAFNLLVAAAAAHLKGLSPEEIRIGVETFEGVLRRQHVVAEPRGITVLEDFAHHPTAVLTTLQGLKEQYGPRRLVAVFEPRSNTSKRGFFQEAYAKSFAPADHVVIQNLGESSGYWGSENAGKPLDVPLLADTISRNGTPAVALTTVEEIGFHLKKELRPGDVVVLMSNGDFGGLPKSLPELLAS